MKPAIAAEVKSEILDKVKSGGSVSKIASEYGISNRTIYGWLSRKAFSSVSVVEYNRIRKENDQLKQIIGILTFEVEKLKKKKSQ